CSNKDPSLLERVATYYTMAKRWDKARDAYQKLSELKPGDQRVMQLLKNTEAQATMNAGWEQSAGKKGGFQNLIANKEQAKKLDQANKAMVVGDDAEALIAEKIAQIEKEPKNMNFRRALARIYIQNKRYAEAVDCLSAAIEAAGAMDPELDRMLSQTRVQYYDQQIDALKAEGNEDAAAELEGEKNQFVFDDLAARVERYPNDLHLRYELGVQYFTYEYYDEALEHLQLAQKSPKDRLWALYYLAMCFLMKGQTDMAVMQLETARDQIPTMDELKKKVVYQLGLCAESQGDLEKAYQYYKDVYSTDVGFEDLSDRMLAVSQALKERQG
ncbi:MAG: tetratricopeptide repeat protein, partial [Kiritimatiellae bacterium]|nr:tetratricopeptide repeat protein [Kiritimatiellia bacterium]